MKKTILILASAALVAAACDGPVSPQDKLTVNDKKIDEIIAQMTLEEKVEMLHSKTNMSSAGVERLGIADMNYADGPFGIREEGVPNGFQSAGWTLDSATYFPTGSALAATWSEELAYKYGTGMGKEARLRGKDVILGPAVNIQRLPVGGRTYEYLSEDPILSAALALEYTKGVQDEGTAVCIKHFAVNNQETNRGSVDAQLDERTLREIYLKPFERAIIEGGAMSVMPAYNKVNGDYCSENEHLLNEILRGEWGFKGFTVSDWGGTHSTMGAMLHGLNVQMTGSNYLGQPVIDSIKAGKLTEEMVDEKVRQILRVRFAIEAVPADVANTVMTSQPESQQIAKQVAEKSIVLLKNEGGILPIKKEVKSIAVIGQNAVLKTQSGGMGAGVKALYEVTPLQGIEKRAAELGISVDYAPGYKTIAFRWGPAPAILDPLEARSNDEPADPFLVAEACEAAVNADLVIFFGGTNKSIETEGSDRKNIDLPCGQNELVKALKAVNPNLITVLISGGPTDLRKLEPVSPAIVQGWWNGTEGGTALAEVLFGDIAPSGKLPFTFPKKLEDSPAYAMGNFPDPNGAGGDLFSLMFRPDVLKMTPAERQKFLDSLPKPVSKYTERFYVGYRWFDTKNIEPMYAFGHGLSYVDFDYDDMKATAGKDAVKVTFQLENEGNMPADEVVQLYVSRPESKVEWPAKELKAFQRVSLNAGETKTVTLEIPMKDLRYWNEATNAWDLEHGKLLLQLGSASDDIRETAEVTI
ncbi:MAG: glycoside hydrolase family 3 C-terminal domain-containing protein [Bacteroidales bacterium]|jgi:beta-glucosidase|nr:glycoside hydrolase family 3 C-terminal domain-containing protein [Bacteroidales bacterium]